MCLLVLVAATIAVNWPGIGGVFLFDDKENLVKLLRFGEVRTFEDLLTALGNGIAGPTGRPVSLLSFLMNDNAWPAGMFSKSPCAFEMMMKM